MGGWEWVEVKVVVVAERMEWDVVVGMREVGVCGSGF